MKRNPFEMLMDENCHENIVFTNDMGEEIEFEQLALIPMENDNYVILHPLNMGYADDEAIAYQISVEGDQYELLEVEDDDLLDEIYFEYKSLYKKKK